MEIIYNGIEEVTIINPENIDIIIARCDNPQFFTSFFRYLTGLYRDTGADIHLSPELIEVAKNTGFDQILSIAMMAAVRS